MLGFTDGGELEASEARLHDAERWLDTPTDKMVVVDKEQFHTFQLRSPPPRLPLLRLATSRHRSVCQTALELPPKVTRPVHAATSLLGLPSTPARSGGRRTFPGPISIRTCENRRNPTLIGITFSWPTSGWRWAASMRRKAAISKTLRIATAQASPCRSERQICIAALVSFPLNGATWKPPANTCYRPEAGRADRADGLVASPVRFPGAPERGAGDLDGASLCWMRRSACIFEAPLPMCVPSRL